MGFLNEWLGIDLPWSRNESGNLESSIGNLNAVCSPYELVGYRKLAIEMAIDLVGNSVARVDWREFKGGKQDDALISYMLNTKPNNYSTKQSFFKRYVRKALLDREVLIIHEGQQLHIADSYDKEFTSYDNIKFTNVEVNGYQMKKSYNAKDVIYINYENEKLTTFLNAYQSDYHNLVNSATEGFQSNKLRKYVLDSDAYRAQDTEIQRAFNDLVEQNFKTFINSTQRASIYAKPKGYNIDKLEDAQQETASDVRSLIEDVFKTTGNAFHIAPNLLITGDATQVQTDNYLMFAVYPLVDAFLQAFNNYMYSQSEIRNDTQVKSDVSKTKVVDLATTADFIQKVFPTGALTLEDVIVKYLNLDTPPEEIKDLRVITKNYDKVDTFVNGEVNDNTNVTVDGTNTISKVSMNGAQVSSLLEIVQQVNTGTLQRESAIALIVSAFPFDESQAEKILGDGNVTPAVIEPVVDNTVKENDINGN